MSTYQVTGICDIYLALEGHICFQHIKGYSMINKLQFIVFLLIYAVMWGLHEDYITSAV